MAAETFGEKDTFVKRGQDARPRTLWQSTRSRARQRQIRGEEVGSKDKFSS